MITSALFAMSAVIVAPPAAKVDVLEDVNGAAATAGTACGAPAAGWLPSIPDGGSGESPVPAEGPAPDSDVPVIIARSVCATRAASAFLR